eukprot:gene15255-18061_t
MGHLWLKDHLNVTVDYGWQIDPFGHSSLTPSMYAQLGFKAMIGNRIPVPEKENLRAKKDLQFIWEGSGSLKDDNRMYTHILYDHYDYVGKVYNPKDMAATGVESRFEVTSKRFFSHIKDIQRSYKHNVILIPWGTDFGYQEQKEFDINNQFINYLLTHKKTQDNIADIRLATLNDYFTLVGKNPEKTPVKLFKQDFFPYSGQKSWS